MKREDKIKLVTLISKFLTVNKLPNYITQEGDDSTIVVNQDNLPVKGINHIMLRHIVNTTNFKGAHFNNVEFIFMFDVSDDVDSFESPKGKQDLVR